jgi:YHS domain-containing protein/thioredoxin-related protein
MKSIALRSCLLAALLAARLHAQEQIAWVNDFQTASGLAAEQRRLVLLHFYNDNCEPCLRLEQNVFNRPEVAEAVHQNYIAVKVHAGQNPQLAARYRVNRWPTDVFVTPVGQEVFRATSPQNPNEYVGVLHRVAQQTGIGVTRPWAQLGPSVVPASAQAALDTQRAAGTFDAAAQQANAAAQSALQQTQDRMHAATSQFHQFANQSQQAVQHGAAAAQQGIQTANQWNQQATTTAHQYQQQAADAREQLRQQAGQFGHDVQQNAQSAQQQFAGSVTQTAQQFQQAASSFAQPWQPAAASPFERRSAFVPQQLAAETAPAAAPHNSASAPTIPILQPPPAAPALAPNGVPLPQQNPWIANKPKEPVQSPASSNAIATAAPPLVAHNSTAPATPAARPGAALQASSQVPSPRSAAVQTGQQPHLVPASQAPPIALDGFCPVTLLDTVARDPSDRTAWKKGDKQFGAIHRGRTYLFTSQAQQQKFLASPDAYAPVLSGCDPVVFAERGQFVDGKRAYGIITPERQIYLFADEASRDRFEKSPASFTATIQQAMQHSEAGTRFR